MHYYERRINEKYVFVCVVVARMFRQQNVYGKFYGKTAVGEFVSFSDVTHSHSAHIHNFISLFTLRNPNCVVMIENMCQFSMCIVLYVYHLPFCIQTEHLKKLEKMS